MVLSPESRRWLPSSVLPLSRAPVVAALASVDLHPVPLCLAGPMRAGVLGLIVWGLYAALLGLLGWGLYAAWRDVDRER